MKKIIYLFIIISLTACSKESNPEKLPPTTDITCYFNSDNTSFKSDKAFKSKYYINNYSFSDKIIRIVITSKINESTVDNVINTIYIDSNEPSINDGITLHGLYTGKNTITTEIVSNYRVYSKMYTPNSSGELSMKEADIIPVYAKIIKENVIITPNCNLNLGVFKPCNAAAKFVFSRDTDDDNVLYRYQLINTINNKRIIFLEKNGGQCKHNNIILSKDVKKSGMIINEEEISKIKIECAKKNIGDHLYTTIGSKIIKLIPGKCLVKNYTEADFITK